MIIHPFLPFGGMFSGSRGSPVIAVTGSATWGNREVGVPVESIFTINNNGTAILTITAISVPSGYTLTDPVLPVNILPSSSNTFTVRFDANFSANGYGGNIIVSSNDPITPNYSIAVSASLWSFYASGASNTAEIGTATRVQIDGTIASNGIKFAYTAQTTPVWGDLSIRSQAVAAISGAANVLVGVLNESTRNNLTFGWFPTATINFDARSGEYTNATNILALVNGTAILPGQAIAASTDYPIASVWRSVGYQQFVKFTAGWVRLWRMNQVDATAYVGLANYDAVGTIEKIKVTPRDTTLFDPSVNLTGSQAAGVTWTAPDGDFVLQFPLTTRPSLNDVRIHFRKKDANNYWRLAVSSGGNVDLYEVIAGVVTFRATGAGAVNGSVITFIADGANIRAFVGTTQAFSYASAYTNMRETAGELNSLGTGGVVSDIQVFKRYLRSTNGLGSELVVNGGFTTDTVWAKGGGWTISGGTANSAGGAFTNLSQAGILTVGKYYEFVFTISNYVSGSLIPAIGGLGVLALISANGTYTVRGICSGDTTLYLQSNSLTASIDNVSCKEIQFTPDSLSTILDGVVNG